MAPQESPRRKHRDRDHEQHRERRRRNSETPRRTRHDAPPSERSSQALSANSLAQLNLINQHERARAQENTPQKTRRKRRPEVVDEKIVVERSRRQHKRKKRRVVSGALLEEGKSQKLRGIRGGYRSDDGTDNGRKKKKLCELNLL
jgi:glucan 1,3-beta-glucosidase